METIIQHVEEFLNKVFAIHAFNITDIDQTASALKKDSDELSRKILQTLIEEMNLSFRADKETRKELGLAIKEKDRKRSILSELGELSFTRDYFYNSEKDCYETPLDQMIGVQKRERIGGAINAKLTTRATDESYEKSRMSVTGGLVSRQSVRNAIMKAPALEKEPASHEKKQVRILDIYADEDHAHLQKPGKEKGKRSKAVPLVTVTEGKTEVNLGRKATVNPMHFVDEKMDSKDLWTSVEGYIDKVYDLEALETIRIHADGGSWIKNGLENFRNVEHVLDGYHLQKQIKKIANKFPNRSVRSRINESIAENNRSKAEAIIMALVNECSDYDVLEDLARFNNYLFSNWEAAVNRFKEGVTGSCTEGQISHVLSKRFSRNPMGWSEEGLGKLSKLRVYCKNGGEIQAEHFKSSYEVGGNYKSYAEEYLEKQRGNYDLSWISEMRETYVFNTASGTQQAIKNLGRIRSGILC